MTMYREGTTEMEIVGSSYDYRRKESFYIIRVFGGGLWGTEVYRSKKEFNKAFVKGQIVEL